jgi:hypothetical protein
MALAGGRDLVDKGWRLVSMGTIVDDGVGNFAANHARLKNEHATTQTAVFTVTLSDHRGRLLGMLVGAVTAAGPGQTVTVRLLSRDPLVAGPYRVGFECDVTL